jgi:hypothetical protein
MHSIIEKMMMMKKKRSFVMIGMIWHIVRAAVEDGEIGETYLKWIMRQCECKLL